MKLFDGTDYMSTFPIRSYDVTDDGRFLFIKAVDRAGASDMRESYYSDRIRVVSNWFDDVRQALPPER